MDKMAGQTLRKLIFGGKQQIINYHKQRPGIFMLHHNQLHTATVPVKEIKIPVPWGQIAGKLWGNHEQRPILALHGWLDNAGTWDALAPMICDKVPILAIDTPGHGLSSSFPRGMIYELYFLTRVIHKIKNYFNWEKVSILGHSMGSINGMRYSSTFPDNVDFFIGFDGPIYEAYTWERLHKVFAQQCLSAESYKCVLEFEPPTFSMDEIIDKWHIGSNKSISKESMHHLIKRGVKPTSTDPNKYYFSRDIRLKHLFLSPEKEEYLESVIRRHQIPSLSIRASETYETYDPFNLKLLEILKENPKFENHIVTGTHHLPLNNPEKVAPIILNFLKNHNFI